MPTITITNNAPRNVNNLYFKYKYPPYHQMDNNHNNHIIFQIYSPILPLNLFHLMPYYDSIILINIYIYIYLLD